MKHPLTTTFALLGALLLCSAPRAQGDPAEEIRQIAEAVEKQLKEIDQLLLDSGKAGQQRATPKQLLEQASEGSKVAEDGIEKLIEKLNEMKGQGGNSNSQSDDQQNQDGQQGQQNGESKPQGQQQQGSSDGNRRENQAPDFVQQPQQGESQPQGQKPGEGENQPGQQQPQPDGGKPQGGQDARTGGENRRGGPATEDPTGPGNRGDGEGQWGNLQPYLNFLKNRGTTPKVPAKYRKYYEAYLKRKANGDKK